MATSEARKIANLANSLKSTGPLSISGKEASRSNAYKHGMTGAGIVLPNEDAAEVDRKIVAYEAELQPTGEVGRELVRRMAVSSLRMDRGVSQETAALSERVRQAEADFVAPDGLDEAIVAQLKAEAMARVLFDPSKEATLARKYEAAAERCFFRSLKELRQLRKDAPSRVPVVVDKTLEKSMASFLQLAKTLDHQEARLDKLDERASSKPPMPRNRVDSRHQTPIDNIFDVPISVGKRR
jgi:hypothetical protein